MAKKRDHKKVIMSLTVRYAYRADGLRHSKTVEDGQKQIPQQQTS